MTITFYTPEEIAIMREGGAVLSRITTELLEWAQPGKTYHEIEMKAREIIEKHGAKTGTIGYKTQPQDPPFPGAVCISVNNIVAHGIGFNDHTKLNEGDILSLDIIIIWKEMFVDICRSKIVGNNASEERKKLVECARATTDAAIKAAMPGKSTEDIAIASELTARGYKFMTIKELGGHGVGKKIHMPPFVPSFKGSGYNTPLKPGMILAIEPIVGAGDWKIVLQKDGWAFRTKDNSDTAQFEETVLITENGPEILTKHT